MKIIDLQEIFEPATSEVRLNKPFTPNPFPKKVKGELGRGVFSIAANDPEDPHLIKKKQIIRPSEDRAKDAFDSFAKIVIKHKLWDKIHFPRIYSVNKTIDSNGREQYDWKIEKLTELGSLDSSELRALAETYFTKDYAATVRGLNATWKFAEKIDQIVRFESFNKYIEDDQLKEALDILRKMYYFLRDRNRHVRLDLHEGNMMIRRTSVGPQLVITDPFAS